MNQEEHEKWIDKKQQKFWTDFFYHRFVYGDDSKIIKKLGQRGNGLCDYYEPRED